jgi:hypothetical protein
MESVLAEPSEEAQFAAAVLAGSLQYLHSLDTAWSNAALLPLMDWSRNPAMAAAAWHGFLMSGRWTQNLLPALVPYYLQTCERLRELPELQRERFVSHMATIFAYGQAQTTALVTRFLLVAETQERLSFARTIGHIVRELEGAERATLWSERLDPYWSLRQQGIPRDLEAEEVAAMTEWLPALENVFDSAVARVLGGRAWLADHSTLLYELDKEGFATRHPATVLRLMGYVLPAAVQPFYSCTNAEALIRSLHRAGIGANLLKPLCESLARLGCDFAGVWRDINGNGDGAVQ